MSDSVGTLNIEVQIQLAKMQAQFDQLTASVRSHNAQIKSEFKGLTDAVTGFFEGMIPAATAAGILDFTKNLIESGAQIQHSADAVRLSAENFQVLGAIAQQTGVPIDTLTHDMDAMEKKIEDAVAGVKEAQQPFQDLGLSFTNLATLSPERQFEAIARAVSSATDQGAAFRDAMDILGTKSAPKLLQALQALGTQGFDSFKSKAIDSGLVLSDSVVKKLDEIETKLGQVGTAAKNNMMTGVAEAAAAFGDKLNDVQVLIDETQRKIDQTLAGHSATTFDPTNQAGFRIETLAELQQHLADLKKQYDALAASELAEQMAAADRAAHKQAFIDNFSDEAAQARIAAVNVQVLADNQQGVFDMQQKGWDAAGSALIQYNGQIDQTYNKLTLLKSPADFVIPQMDGTSGPSDAMIKKANAMYVDALTPMEQYELKLQVIAQMLDNNATTADRAGVMEAKAQQEYLDALAKADPARKADEESMRHWAEFAKQTGGEISQALVDAFNGSATAFHDLGQMVIQQLEKMAAEVIVVTPIFHAFGALLKDANLTGGFTSALLDYKPTGSALGGRVSAGTPALVGEMGPEVFVPDGNGSIIANNNLGGSGGDTYYIDARGADQTGLAQLSAQIRAVNGSIEGRAVAAWQNVRRRGGSPASALS